MSAAAVALLAARPAFVPGAGVGVFLVAALAMGAWAASVAIAYRRSRGLRAWPPLPGRLTIGGFAVITAGFAVLGTVLVML